MARPSMSRAFIVEGDAHSHGGHVLAGSEHAGIDGQAFACEGHPAICPCMDVRTLKVPPAI
ncbi:PAAR domain-containing protein [Xanthomonas oryzae pv. oryzae]|nr:PAAR domain-containing protein [Xanthomonas oryzae pv. oryzae]